MTDKKKKSDTKDAPISLLLEMRADPGMAPSLGMNSAPELAGGALTLDPEFVPVAMGGDPEAQGFSDQPQTYILRGTVETEDQLRALEEDPQVVRVWRDTPIAPFVHPGERNDAGPRLDDNPAMSTCPIGTCDCTPRTPVGSIADVARYLGADQIWARGYRGAGIVVGVLDGGITAQGRPVKAGETARRIPRVIGGWPVASWGTEASGWSEHGNMCATDVLGMAPEAQIFDMRISGSGGSVGTISRALQAFDWAINHYRTHGTPQILTNSWGIFQESWDATYARNPNHPFTRKVVEAVNAGIIVLFAAGNCGDTCPDGRCGPDTGTGRSIWGANGHDAVMTVGAVNLREQFVGYSSRGPAALSQRKPDFCAITHFTGYHNSDSGTSAATPILAGICALLRQVRPTATTATLKTALIATCKDIGAAGFDVHSGHGIVQPKGAFDRLVPVLKPPLLDTTPIRDLRETVITLDRPTTPIVPDRVATRIVDDQLGTPVLADRPGTPIVADQIGTPVIIDQRQTSVLLDKGGTPIAERVDLPDPGRPFVLATGHQAPEWQDFQQMLGGPTEDPLSELAAQIDQVHAMLEALVAQYQAATGQA
jgi:serine protease AprX